MTDRREDTYLPPTGTLTGDSERLATGDSERIATGDSERIATGDSERIAFGAESTHASQSGDFNQTAADETRQVASTAKEQAQAVGSEVKDQAKLLLDETRGQLSEQTSAQRDRAAERLRAVGDELTAMAENSPEAGGLGGQLARQGGDYARRAAEYLEAREPADFVEDVRGFARRRPAMFLLGAAAAGVIVGRMSRGAVDAHRDTDDSGGAHRADTTAAPAADTAPTVTSYDESLGVPLQTVPGAVR